jgi:hypothetical protein
MVVLPVFCSVAAMKMRGVVVFKRGVRQRFAAGNVLASDDVRLDDFGGIKLAILHRLEAHQGRNCDNVVHL